MVPRHITTQLPHKVTEITPVELGEGLSWAAVMGFHSAGNVLLEEMLTATRIAWLIALAYISAGLTLSALMRKAATKPKKRVVYGDREHEHDDMVYGRKVLTTRRLLFKVSR